jgi:hypothetical protein
VTNVENIGIGCAELRILVRPEAHLVRPEAILVRPKVQMVRPEAILVRLKIALVRVSSFLVIRLVVSLQAFRLVSQHPLHPLRRYIFCVFSGPKSFSYSSSRPIVDLEKTGQNVAGCSGSRKAKSWAHF